MERMRRGRFVALALAAAGAGLLAWAAVVWSRGSDSVETWRVRQAEKESELRSTWDELKEFNLRYQAFQKSFPAVPDSIRMASGKQFREEGRTYEKAIRKLEFAERDLKLEITNCKRKQAKAAAERKDRALPIAAGGAGAWLGAAVAAIASRPRREAA
ncbi:MAG TPA: hypothetical protein VEC56_12960 [Candidatus Krumholzibacteria bacterium]|nr:hypothetical protein [Candidatus Krumholzibacteria bacterium]